MFGSIERLVGSVKQVLFIVPWLVDRDTLTDGQALPLKALLKERPIFSTD